MQQASPGGVYYNAGRRKRPLGVFWAAAFVRDSVEQYTAANRADLAAKEQFEIDVMNKYLPQQMSDDEIKAVVAEAVMATGAVGMAGMGKVMGVVKAKCAGRADMGKVSALVKAALTA